MSPKISSTSPDRDLTIKFIESISDIAESEWLQLASIGSSLNPFVDPRFLSVLEKSQSVTAEKGWKPLHVAAYTGNQLVAFMPLYLKGHSFGEFVFDWAWANAYQRHGLEYYPKALTASPLSPITGPRLLHCGLTTEQQLAIVAAVSDWLQQNHISSWHINFPDPEGRALLDQTDLLTRRDVQFHWRNQGYTCFDEFLSNLKAKKRKNILRERRHVSARGWTFEWLSGIEATMEDWQCFYELYKKTFDEKGSWSQLTPEFFPQLAESMGEQVLLLFARKDAQRLAGAFFIKSETHLYGRYWGALIDEEFLHFETCYYQGIEYAIAHQLEVFEPGAQGEHKLARGFNPVLTYSYHYIVEPAFREAIDKALRYESKEIEQLFEYYQSHSAYKLEPKDP
ncbi:GNAT family N-acetyltransferase [Kangiella aquimarina]|uniref:GNAT family N-acetyltransferase n=1 Tax=Kangiella aquimarina TaxID=261965 RepID=A0ABZ0X1A8_9GAMM|nr:GNAT family N-acetyltransferase [Kangiella aquimarina]WQG84174.1 GNAT family N-acetyltransferase [Kangiella aquimarina]